MNEPWTVDAFLRWQADKEDSYELVGGFPLMIVREATRRHNTVVVNVIALLRTKLRATRYRPFTRQFAVETRPGQIRRPDIGVDGGPTHPDALIASEAAIVFEVLSSSTDFDRMRKIAEYKDMPFLRHIVLMAPDRALATIWSRVGQCAWEERTIEGLDGTLELSGIAVDLPMRAIYDGPLT